MFRLEAAIEGWCRAVRAGGCPDEASVEELRDHLCCRIEGLRANGLGEEEAFRRAVMDLGPIEEIAAEFAREAGAMAPSITPAEVAVSTRQLATLMKSGVGVAESLSLIEDGTPNPHFKYLLRRVRDDVAAGKSLADALRMHPRQYDALFCDMVAAAERADRLQPMLDRIASYKEKTLALTAQIARGLKYPALVLLVGIVSVGALVSGRPDAIGWWLLLGFLAVAVPLGYLTVSRNSKAMREAQDRALLKLPVIGPLLQKAAVARFSRTLSTTFISGVPLADALNSVAGSAGNVVYEEAIFWIRDEVKKGVQLNHAMKMTGVFPGMVVQMVALGEAAGALDDMLDKAATYYEEQVNANIDTFTGLMGPIIIAVLLGVIVAHLVWGGHV